MKLIVFQTSHKSFRCDFKTKKICILPSTYCTRRHQRKLEHQICSWFLWILDSIMSRRRCAQQCEASCREDDVLNNVKVKPVFFTAQGRACEESVVKMNHDSTTTFAVFPLFYWWLLLKSQSSMQDSQLLALERWCSKYLLLSFILYRSPANWLTHCLTEILLLISCGSLKLCLSLHVVCRSHYFE